MNTQQFDQLTAEDFKNGAVRDEIRTVIACAEKLISSIQTKLKHARGSKEEITLEKALRG